MLNKFDQLHAFLLLVVLVVSDHLYASISRYDLFNFLLFEENVYAFFASP